jgi:hypothetical protein
MTAGSRRDDKHQPGDALDRAIDETLGAAMHAHAVDLRERVLARLDEPVGAMPVWWRFLLRPALLPAAGAALLVIGVALTWQHVDDTLVRVGAPRPTTKVAATRPHAAAAPKTKPDAARASAAPPSTLGAGVAPAPKAGASGGSETRTSLVRRPFRLRPSGFGGQAPLVPAAASDRVILAASFLEMDAMSAPALVGAETVLIGDEAEPSWPGAPAGDLGDPIKPMPPLRPIVIQPIFAAPIVDVPPVSTLAQPLSTLPTIGEISRDPSGPGKSEGVRP